MHHFKPLNLFYEEPDPDRWLPFDRYPRRLIRRIYRGKPQPRGHLMVFNNLVKGLDKLGISYRVNDYRYARQHPSDVVGIIGKDQLLFDHQWKNPIVLGAAIGINPINYPNLLEDYPHIKQVLVPGNWSKELFSAYGEDQVTVWPVGIDTGYWTPGKDEPDTHFLIYNKVMWDKEKKDADFVEPLRKILRVNQISFTEIKYGHYKPAELKAAAARCKYVLFLCEHETQGIAYQQLLAMDLPTLAWDKGGYWEDPYWYPHQVRFKPVTSAPYWDSRCGEKFTALNDFEGQLKNLLDKAASGQYHPREFILDHLTLEKCAANYATIIRSFEY